eukprot:g5527.t1
MKELRREWRRQIPEDVNVMYEMAKEDRIRYESEKKKEDVARRLSSRSKKKKELGLEILYKIGIENGLVSTQNLVSEDDETFARPIDPDDGIKLIGRRVRVWFEMPYGPVLGTITDYNNKRCIQVSEMASLTEKINANAPFRVDYSDGTMEWLYLPDKDVEIIQCNQNKLLQQERAERSMLHKRKRKHAGPGPVSASPAFAKRRKREKSNRRSSSSDSVASARSVMGIVAFKEERN